jgi:hypothetical protein
LKDKFIEISLNAKKEHELLKLVENIEKFWKDAQILIT